MQSDRPFPKRTTLWKHDVGRWDERTICRDIELVEELSSNAVITTFGEMSRADEVAATEMDAEVHIRWSFETIVVESDVCVEQLIDGTSVGGILLPAFDHLFGAEICRQCKQHVY